MIPVAIIFSWYRNYKKYYCHYWAYSIPTPIAPKYITLISPRSKVGEPAVFKVDSLADPNGHFRSKHFLQKGNT